MNNNANERDFNEVLERALTFKKQRSKKNRRHRVVRVLAAIVAFATTYTLIIPAITMESESMQVLICEKESHMHGESCYTVETTLTCGLEESEPHVHSDSCYESVEMSTLTCTVSDEEHTHDSGCYTTETELVLACGENGGGHTHSDACYTTERVLTCEKEEHAHTNECFELREPGTVTDENGENTENNETAENGGENTENTADGAADTETEGENLGGEIADGKNDTENGGNTENTENTENGGDENTENAENENTEPVEDIVENTEVNIDEYVPYVTDEALIDFHIVGTINIDAVKENADLDAAAVDTAEAPELGGEAAQSEQETAENIDNAVNETEIVENTDNALNKAETAENAETVDNAAAETDIGAAEANGENTEAENESEPIAENENSGFNIEIIDNLIDSSDEEVLLERELTVAASYNGVLLDLSNCEITAEITPSEFMVEYVESGAQTYAISEETAEEPAEQTEMGVEITVSDESGNEDTMLLLADTEFEPITMALTGAKMTMRSVVTPNPSFTVQYWATLSLIDRYATGTDALEIINTSRNQTAETTDGKGGTLPTNTGTPATSKITIDSTGKIKTTTQNTKIYQDHEFKYYAAPGLNYFDIVTTNTENYEITHIGILKPGVDKTNATAADWLNIPFDKQTVHFTNRVPESIPESDITKIGGKVMYYTSGGHTYIAIGNQSVFKLTYAPSIKNPSYPVDFYDYDISNGKIYTSAANANKAGTANYNKENDPNAKNTSDQTNDKTWYMYTDKQGINGYSASGAKLAFGNANAGSGLDTQKWKYGTGDKEIIHINRYNRASDGVTATYKGAAYGMVTGMNEKGTDVTFADGIVSPGLFGVGGPEAGKTSVDGELTFSRTGDTYILSAATLKKEDGSTGVTGGLDKFKHPGTYNNIWTNDFWPMDNADSYGTDGHDMKFGSKALKGNRKIHKDTTAPESDDGKDHNSYFGMNFSVGFKLTEDYIGPLEYYFFGDDDMWVFLSEYDETTKTYSNSKLICDIGGIHSAVGEYVNLWDYIDRTKLGQKDENGDEIAKSYALTFFYTERGASGSTCWMSFTLPSVVGLNLEAQIEETLQNNTSALVIEKKVEGAVVTDRDFEFVLHLETAEGNMLPDDYKFTKYDANGNVVKYEDGGDLILRDEVIHSGSNFMLKDGEKIIITNLPNGAKYKVEEIVPSDKSHFPYKISYDIITTDENKNQVNERNGDGSIAEGTISATETKKLLDTVTIINTASPELPSTGGSGTTYLYAIGALLILLAGCLMYKRIQLLRKEGGAED